MVLLLLQIALIALSVNSCAKAQSYGELRLVRREDGSSSAAGLLEIFLNEEWGTICDSGFDFIDANVACRQIGYRAAVDFTTAFHSPFDIGNQNQSVWLSDIDCRDPNGVHLLSCAHGEVGVHDSADCNDHFFDVAVMCDERPLQSSFAPGLEDGSVRLTGGLHNSQGIIEIARGGGWRTVCASNDAYNTINTKGTTGFSQREANAICWQLGFTEASSYRIQETPLRNNSSLDDQQDGHTWCSLQPCTKDYQSCTFTCSNNTEMICSANPQSSNATYGMWVECNHTITYGSVRLAAHGEMNAKSGGGRLEIFIEGYWGTVCAAMFGLREADVACQQLGYYRALWYNHSSAVSRSLKKEEIHTLPIALMGVKCTSEDDKIGYCSRHPLPEGEACTHNDDIILACTNDPIVTTGAEVIINSWPLPFSKKFLIEISIGAGLGLILCCCCLVVWCTHCCRQCSNRRRKHSKRKLSQLLLPDNTQELGITGPDDSEMKQQDIIVLAAHVQDQLKPSPVPCTSPVVPKENQGISADARDDSNGSSEDTEPSANNGEEVANMSASTTESHVESEQGMGMGIEQENKGGRENGRQWVRFSMEPIPEERDGELEEDTSCEQVMESADQQQPSSSGAIEGTGQENIENEELGMGMDCTTTMLQSSDAITNHDQLETEI